jgi:hypothetical protein
MLYPKATSTVALGAVDIQHVELVDQISKDDSLWSLADIFAAKRDVRFPLGPTSSKANVFWTLKQPVLLDWASVGLWTPDAGKGPSTLAKRGESKSARASFRLRPRSPVVSEPVIRCQSTWRQAADPRRRSRRS